MGRVRIAISNPMNRLLVLCLGGVGLLGIVMASPAHALPGQSVDQVTAWIQAHPTLQPAPGERLMVRKSDTAARRFTFQASLTPPGAVTGESSSVIRSEQISLVDLINGVSSDRLEETLRIIYGLEIHQDYEQAIVVYTYSYAASGANNSTGATLRGEVRQGDRFSYWSELIPSSDGMSQTGRITVFLDEDLPQLITELQTR